MSPLTGQLFFGCFADPLRLLKLEVPHLLNLKEAEFLLICRQVCSQ